ncbi:hypothetical protein ABT104_24715, partial [Streptomyces mobaraensis]|uniref:hypothetical protein n=1 Tax=Streptomyces mobaraensis TaxID=35621 RepID=UPI0033235AC2
PAPHRGKLPSPHTASELPPTHHDKGHLTKHYYGVLMTRSIRGLVLYSVDPATRKLFADLGVRKL